MGRRARSLGAIVVRHRVRCVARLAVFYDLPAVVAQAAVKRPQRFAARRYCVDADEADARTMAAGGSIGHERGAYVSAFLTTAHHPQWECAIAGRGAART